MSESWANSLRTVHSPSTITRKETSGSAKSPAVVASRVSPSASKVKTEAVNKSRVDDLKRKLTATAREFHRVVSQVDGTRVSNMAKIVQTITPLLPALAELQRMIQRISAGTALDHQHEPAERQAVVETVHDAPHTHTNDNEDFDVEATEQHSVIQYDLEPAHEDNADSHTSPAASPVVQQAAPGPLQQATPGRLQQAAPGRLQPNVYVHVAPESPRPQAAPGRLQPNVYVHVAPESPRPQATPNPSQSARYKAASLAFATHTAPRPTPARTEIRPGTSRVAQLRLLFEQS